MAQSSYSSSWSWARQCPADSSNSSINPPIPTAQSQQQRANSGQRLLALLRSLDKHRKDRGKNANNISSSSSTNLRETIQLLRELAASVHRRGLLQGDAVLAQQVLRTSTTKAAANSGSGSGRPRNGKRKGSKRGRNGSSSKQPPQSNDLSLQPTADGTTAENGAPALDAQLLLSALARVLETTSATTNDAQQQQQQQQQQAPNNNIDKRSSSSGVLVLAAAADACTAAGEYLKSRPAADACFLAEYELLAAHGRAFLLGIERHIRALWDDHCYNNLRQQQQQQQQHDVDCEILEYAMTACLRAACTIVSLFGNKLSRVPLSGLREVAWLCCCCCGNAIENDYDNDNNNNRSLSTVVEAAATLVATLPLAGGTGERNTPALSWNRALRETVDALAATLRTVAPIGNSSSSNSGGSSRKKQHQQEGEGTLPDNSVWKIVQERCIITLIENAPSETVKVSRVLQLVDGLVRAITGLLARDAIGVGMVTALPIQAQLLGCQVVNAEALLRLVETMLSFSTAAESKYYATKKRLRQETTSEGGGDGLLSPASIACELANRVRLWGHRLLDATVAALGAAALVPHARRILKASHGALVTASSANLRKALDPSAAWQTKQQQHAKRQRWLHTAITLRTASIQSFRVTLLAFGTDPKSLSTPNSSSVGTGRSSKRGGDMDRAISMVCGVVVEELTAEKLPAFGGDWGTFDDRVKLVAVALDALVASLNSGGEYLSTSTRGLIDSVVSTSLSILQQGHPMTSQAAVKAGILSLGSACVATPWQDGATCATVLVDGLRHQAQACQQDQDSAVSSMAVAALRLCDALSCPRAPALQIVTRSDPYGRSSAGGTSHNGVYTVQTAEDIADKLNFVREDENRSKKREEKEAAEAAAKAEQQEQPTPRKKMKRSTAAKEGAPEPSSSTNVPNNSETEPVEVFKSANNSGTAAVVDEKGKPEIGEPNVAPKEQSSENDKTAIESSSTNVPNKSEMEPVEVFKSANNSGTAAVVDEKGKPEIAEPNVVTKEQSSENDKTAIESSKHESEATKDLSKEEADVAKAVNEGNSDDDEVFPMIVDCGPDGEDGE